MQMRVNFADSSRDCVKLRTPCLLGLMRRPDGPTSMGGLGRRSTLVEEVGERR